MWLNQVILSKSGFSLVVDKLDPVTLLKIASEVFRRIIPQVGGHSSAKPEQVERSSNESDVLNIDVLLGSSFSPSSLMPLELGLDVASVDTYIADFARQGNLFQ